MFMRAANAPKTLRAPTASACPPFNNDVLHSSITLRSHRIEHKLRKQHTWLDRQRACAFCSSVFPASPASPVSPTLSRTPCRSRSKSSRAALELASRTADRCTHCSAAEARVRPWPARPPPRPPASPQIDRRQPQTQPWLPLPPVALRERALLAPQPRARPAWGGRSALSSHCRQRPQPRWPAQAVARAAPVRCVPAHARVWPPRPHPHPTEFCTPLGGSG